MSQRTIAAAIVAVSIVLGYFWHTNAVSKASEAARSSVKQQYEATYVEGLKTSLNASNELLKEANTAKEKLEHEKSVIAKRHSDIVSGLQKRATRAESQRPASNTTTYIVTCTGAELSREDAEFLAGEAARAERILKERDDYYEHYTRARKALETLQGELGR